MNDAALISLPFIGLILGAFGTFIGTGGGFLFVPALLLLFPEEKAEMIAAISLVTVLVNALSGTVASSRQGRIAYRTGLTLAIAMVPGAILGAQLTNVLGRELFQLLFGALFIALALYILGPRRVPQMDSNAFVLEPARSSSEYAAVPSTYHIPYGPAMATGFAAGFAGGMLGIGGGAVLMVSMVGFLGFPAQLATGTAQFTIIFSSMAAVGTHLSHVSLQEMWLRAALLAIGAALGSQVGARISIRSSSRMIERSLAVPMIVVGAWLVQQAL